MNTTPPLSLAGTADGGEGGGAGRAPSSPALLPQAVEGGEALLGLPPDWWDARGAHWTAREIAQQPRVWQAVEQAVAAVPHLADGFLAPLLATPGLRIVLTGAGSSAFVGQCLAPELTRRLGRRVDAVATTDLVAGPRHWLVTAEPLLLVSFARSGNSPESVAALELAQQGVPRCHHLVFTCNAEGALRQRAQALGSARVVLLPDACNDRSFAMTSSFSAMLLAAARVLGGFGGNGTEASAVRAGAQAVLDHALPLTRSLAQERFERVIYLGANALGGLAREAALKLLELTDGRVVSLADTPLGFRHGPKTIVNARTLVVLFLSHDLHARRYDLDLLRELRADGVAGRVLALTARPQDLDMHADDFALADLSDLSDIGLCFPYVVFAQLLALQHAVALGVTPDNPNPSGVVNRVVKGVRIHGFGAAD